MSPSSVSRTVFTRFFGLKPTPSRRSPKRSSCLIPSSTVWRISMSPLISFFSVSFFSLRLLHCASLWYTTVSITSLASTYCLFIFSYSSSIHDRRTYASPYPAPAPSRSNSGCLLLRLPSSFSYSSSPSPSSSWMRLTWKQSSSSGTSCHSEMWTVLSEVSTFSLQMSLRFCHSSFWWSLMMQPLGGSQYLALVTLLMKQGSPVSSQMSILHISNSSLSSLSSPDPSPSFPRVKFSASTRSSFSGNSMGAPQSPLVLSAMSWWMADRPLLQTLFLYSSICFSSSDPLAALGMLAVLRRAFCFCASRFWRSSRWMAMRWNLMARCLFCRCRRVSSCSWISFLLQGRLMRQYSHHFLPAIRSIIKYTRRGLPPWFYWIIGKQEIQLQMSTERQERAASLPLRQRTVKVSLNFKLLPVDFFPRINSQSPRKRQQAPSKQNDSLLAEWFEREESKEKPQKVFRRLAHARPTASRVQLGADQPSQEEKKRYVLDCYPRAKENLKSKPALKLPSTFPRPIFGEERRFIRRKASTSSREGGRLVRSESRPRQERSAQVERGSVRELGGAGVAFSFDGMVTFSRFK